MDALSTDIVGLLLRIAAVQWVAWLLLSRLLDRMKLQSPGMVRLACVSLLVPIGLLMPLSISLPWYAAEPARPAVEAVVADPGNPQHDLPQLTDQNAMPTMPVKPRSASNAGSTISIASAGLDRAGWEISFQRTIQLLGWLLVAGWATGTLVALLAPAAAYVRFVRNLPPPLSTDDAWSVEWHEALRRAGVAGRIPFRTSRDSGPALCLLPGGYTVVVPEWLWCASSRRERLSILAHEAAHCRRGDVWKSWLAWLLAAPFWFSPAARWAARTFDECAELCCDRWAAPTPAERIDYAKTLRRLAGLRRRTWAVGSCADGHPLVSRVRLLLASPEKEKSTMNRMILAGAIGALMIGHSVRVELVAEEPTATREMARQRIVQIETALAELSAKVKKAEAAGKALKEYVELRLDELKAMAQGLDGFPDDVQRRIQQVQTSVEADQLKAIEGAGELADGGLILLAYAAADSPHPSVRRAALQTAAELGKAGLPVIAHAFNKLPEADRLYLVEQLADVPSMEQLFALLLIADEEEGPVHEAAVKAGTSSDHRLLFTAMLAKHSDPARMLKLVDVASGFEGDEGLVLLYAAAGFAEPEVRVAAIEAAVERGVDGLVVVKPAFDSKEPKVRAAIVRAARKVGGPVGEAIVDKALSDEDETLRQAAEEAMEPDEQSAEASEVQ